MGLRQKVSAILFGVSFTFIFTNWIDNNASVPKSTGRPSVILKNKLKSTPRPHSRSSFASIPKSTSRPSMILKNKLKPTTRPHSLLSFAINSKRKKVILSWTTFFGVPLNDKYLDTCPELRQICEMTISRDRYSESEAIVFHAPEVDWSKLPPNRGQNQRYVFLLHEPPTKDWFKVDVKRDFYNWTMTYRMDSDIPYPYSHLEPNSTASQELEEKSISKKTGVVVWFVSNCRTPSNREKYVEQLKRYISVDIYGLCGRKNCKKVEDPPGISVVAPCEKNLIDRVYKFYIAFENSVCRDYITEKFFHRRNFNSVPIVLSRKIVQDYLPPKSFIAIDDFPKGPKELADYLKYLMGNHTEYMRYLEWKKIGYAPSKANPKTGMQWGFCGLCEKLWRTEIDGRKESKVYKSIGDWWGQRVSCDAGFMKRLIG